jgi:hypothetical protein
LNVEIIYIQTRKKLLYLSPYFLSLETIMSVSNWYHTRPKEYFAKCVEMFGPPDSLSNEKHGIAYWKTRGLFDEHMLRDEDVKHCVPRNHHDYFYSGLKIHIPNDKLLDVLRISGSINYDGLKHMLTARCGGIGANYATLYLGMSVASGKLSIEDVKKDDMYPKMIQEKLLSYDEMKKRMLQMKRSNHKRYAKNLQQDFANYAYTKCYTEPKNLTKIAKTKPKSNKTRRLKK